MDIRQLELLRELGDRGSVSAVARALFVTPSAVSQQLGALQREVPVPLTQKRGRALELTDAGWALVDAAAPILLALAAARGAVEAFIGDETATVRVSAFTSAALAFFPRLVRAFPGDSPGLALADEDVAHAEFPALTGDYDLVLAHRLPHSPAWPSRLHVVPLLWEPLDVALPAAHPLAGRAALSPADIADEPWVAVHEGFPLRGVLETIGAVAGRPLRVAHEINEFPVSAAMVAAGGGIALMPRFTAGPLEGIVLRPLSGLRVGRQIDVLLRPDRAIRRSVATVLDALRTIASELAA